MNSAASGAHWFPPIGLPSALHLLCGSAIAYIKARRAMLINVAAHGFVLFLFIAYATAGTFQFKAGGDYYSMLADAFSAGQLYLKIAPSPELLALPDPYDPVQNAPFRLHDASLYDGKYFLYFGPLPGVIYAAWKGLTGGYPSEMLIQALVGFGTCFWIWLILVRIRRLAFPKLPEAAVLLVYLCISLGGVGLYLQARATAYHESYLWAAFFMFAGLYWFLRGLEGGSCALLSFALGGLGCGLALACRPIQYGYPLGAGLVLGWSLIWGSHRLRALGSLVAFSIPVTIGGALLLAYNYARFGSFAENGTGYVLAGIRLNTPFDLSYVPNTFLAYLLTLPTFIPYFPFQYSANGFALTSLRGWYLEPPVTSVILLAPLLIMMPLLLYLISARWKSWRSAPVHRLLIAISFGAITTFATLLTWLWTTGRYMHEFLPAFALLGGVALWWLYPRRRYLRLPYWALSLCFLVVSAVMGMTYPLELYAYPTVDKPGPTYWFDRAESKLLRFAVPSAWPDTYLRPEIRNRPYGDFYPANAVLTFKVPAGARVTGVQYTLVGSVPDGTTPRFAMTSETEVGVWFDIPPDISRPRAYVMPILVQGPIIER